MPKRFATPDPQITMYADGTFYVRIGDRERSLGTKDFGIACKRKAIAVEKISGSGEASSLLRCGDVWPDYEYVRKMQYERGEIVEATKGKARRVRKPISKGTFDEIKYVWTSHLKGYWERVRLDKIDDEKWCDYVEQSLVIDLANHRKVFSGFLKWCKKKKYIKFLPDLEIPSVERRTRHVLKPKEINKIFEHAEGSLLLFVSMYLFMGMRRKEIMTLKWSDIHMDERYLVLRKSEVKTRTSRPLPLNIFVQDLLLKRKTDQLSEHLKTDFVFPNRKDPKRHADVSGLKTAWQTMRKRCEFPDGYITPHDLRATYEAYAHKASEFTDTQREKMAGAAIDVQKKTYVRFDAHDLRGLEAVVQVDGLAEILSTRLKGMGKTRGGAKDDRVH
jgi:integrase